MPAKDTDHEAVKSALIAQGWTINFDPYVISVGEGRVFVDLGGERPLAAEKDGEKIAVEVKSFRGASPLKDFQQAVGQYLIYNSLLRRLDPNRLVFLAVPEPVYERTFQSAIVRPLLEDVLIRLAIFRPTTREIVRWIR